MFVKANDKSQLLDGVIGMLLSMETDPESRCELLIVKTGKELMDKATDLVAVANKNDTSAEQKQKILEYLTAIKGGLDTFIEASNFNSEE